MILCKIDLEENSNCKKCCKCCTIKCCKRCVFDKNNIECDSKSELDKWRVTMGKNRMWFVGYDREDKSRRLLLSSEDFNLIHSYYKESKRKYRVENDIKLYIWSE